MWIERTERKFILLFPLRMFKTLFWFYGKLGNFGSWKKNSIWNLFQLSQFCVIEAEIQSHSYRIFLILRIFKRREEKKEILRSIRIYLVCGWANGRYNYEVIRFYSLYGLEKYWMLSSQFIFTVFWLKHFNALLTSQNLYNPPCYPHLSQYLNAL